MKKIKVAAIAFVVAATSTMGIFMTGCSRNRYDFVIGVNNIVTAQVTGEVYSGFRNTLTAMMDAEGKRVRFDYQNANGDGAAAQTIATNHMARRVDMMFAIGTVSKLAAINAAEPTGTPVVFGAATDPTGSNLVRSHTTGTSNRLDFVVQMQLLREFLGIPDAPFYVAYIYQADQDNARAMGDLLVPQAATQGITVIRHRMDSLATQLLTTMNTIHANPRYRAIFTGSCSVTDAAYAQIADLNESGGARMLPVMAAISGKVDRGAAVLSSSHNYYHLGAEAAKAAFQILVEGVRPDEVRFNGARYYTSNADELNLVINETIAARLGITIPESMRNRDGVRIIN